MTIKIAKWHFKDSINTTITIYDSDREDAYEQLCKIDISLHEGSNERLCNIAFADSLVIGLESSLELLHIFDAVKEALNGNPDRLSNLLFNKFRVQ